VLLAEEPRMLFTMFAYLRWRAIHLGK